MSGKITTKKLAAMGIVAAVYAALTVALSWLSYMGVQFRIAEALMLLCFYRKEYIPALTAGCFLANLFSPMALDMVFGTAATLIAAIAMAYAPNIYVASVFPVVSNAFIVGFELWYFVKLPFWLSVGQVALGEFVCICVLGIVLFKAIEKNRTLMDYMTFGEGRTV